MDCEFCNKKFKTIGILNTHKKTAKYCIKIQEDLGVKDSELFFCKDCNKSFSAKHNLEKHVQKCLLKYTNTINELEKRNKELEKQLIESEERIKYIDQKHFLELQNKLQEIALTAIDQKNEVIANMVKKYVKKQPRQQFDCSNVVYILTTKSLEKDRRYILGKAKNLTSRLSTYNKTDEHQVIYYQDCGDEETMNTLEPLVFKKLGDYREQANRERFILPDNSSIDLFIDTIKNCFEFLK